MSGPRRANALTPWGKRIYRRHKETLERSFVDAKQLHGHRYARFRGLLAVTCQCLLAAAQNIKKNGPRVGLRTPSWAEGLSKFPKNKNPAENRRGLSTV